MDHYEGQLGLATQASSVSTASATTAGSTLRRSASSSASGSGLKWRPSVLEVPGGNSAPLGSGSAPVDTDGSSTLLLQQPADSHKGSSRRTRSGMGSGAVFCLLLHVFVCLVSCSELQKAMLVQHLDRMLLFT